MAAGIHQSTTRGSLITWRLTADDPEGEWVNASENPHKTVCIEGGRARLFGAMSREGQAFELRDAHDNAIKSPDMFSLSLNPLFIRPVLIGADSGTVIVTIVGTSR